MKNVVEVGQRMNQLIVSRLDLPLGSPEDRELSSQIETLKWVLDHNPDQDIKEREEVPPSADEIRAYMRAINYLKDCGEQKASDLVEGILNRRKNRGLVDYYEVLLTAEGKSEQEVTTLLNNLLLGGGLQKRDRVAWRVLAVLHRDKDGNLVDTNNNQLFREYTPNK